MEEAELIEANPRYAYIHLQNGKETTLSLRGLVLAGLVQNYSPGTQVSDLLTQCSEILDPEPKIPTPNETESITAKPVKKNRNFFISIRVFAENSWPFYVWVNILLFFLDKVKNLK